MHVAGDSGHITDHNHIVDDLTVLRNSQTDWVNAVTQFSADPSGVADSTTAIQNALNSAPVGGAAFLPAGVYLTSAPITIPVGKWLVGNQGFRAGARNTSSIMPGASFTGAAVLTFAAGTPSSAVQNIMINGTNLPGGNTVDGIDLIGAVKQWSLLNCVVQHCGGHGVNITNSGGNNPDGGLIRELSLNNNGLDGLHWSYCVDSLGAFIHSDSNGQAGVYLGNLNNTSLYGVKSQGNGTYGYNFNVSFGKPSGAMVGCFSENNQQDGFHATSLSNAGTISFIGCVTNNDGNAGVSGSGYCGFNFTSTGVDLLFVGCANYITTTANGPDYGLKLTNCTGSVIVDGCSLLGSVAAYLNGGGNTHVEWHGAVWGVGESDSRTVTYAPNTITGLAASVSYHPANPASTTSTTLVMMGVGSTCVFTPLLTGICRVTVTGTLQTLTAAVAGTYGGRYGTGAAPANGAAVTGTRFGGAADPGFGAGGTGKPQPFCLDDVVSLTAGTAYWFDVALDTGNVADAAQVQTLCVTVQELPA